jgi:hypothetical protein
MSLGVRASVPRAPCNKTSNSLTPRPDLLTRRHGTWHFVRRVLAEFAGFDKRGIIKHSTKVRISEEDRNGRRASRVAQNSMSNWRHFGSRNPEAWRPRRCVAGSAHLYDG